MFCTQYKFHLNCTMCSRDAIRPQPFWWDADTIEKDLWEGQQSRELSRLFPYGILSMHLFKM